MTARINGMEKYFWSCKIGTSASSAMELVSDAKESTVGHAETHGEIHASNHASWSLGIMERWWKDVKV